MHDNNDCQVTLNSSHDMLKRLLRVAFTVINCFQLAFAFSSLA